MKKSELNLIIESERILYLTNNPAKQADMKKRLHKRYLIWKYLYCFRSWQFYRDLRSDKSASSLARKIAKLKSHYYEKKKNILSYKSGVEIGVQCKIGQNCDIWHSGVVINGDVGDDCTFHGNNIIGNKGKGKEKQSPKIGNGVDIGANAVIIGDVTIADNCIIGAGAVVTKSFPEPGSIIVGVPGKKI